MICHYARQRAKRRKIEFSLTENDITIPSHCPVLGVKLKFNWSGLRSGYFPDSPSIDRIDNTKGYVKDNVRIISNRANNLKKRYNTRRVP